MKKHIFWTLITCIIPILLLFVLPTLGFSEIVTDFFLVIVLLTILILMPGSFNDMDKTGEPIHEEKLKTAKDSFKIDPKKLGLSIGGTFVLLYLGCMFMMHFSGHEETVLFFNNMFHGIDTSGIIKMHVKFTDTLAGIVELFVLGTFIGICIGGFYNILLKGK